MSWSTPLTALPHLSDEAVAAFADGVLSGSARARAQSHMSGCAECSEAVVGQRAARAALRSALTPSLPSGLLERLRELPSTAELPPSHIAALSADGQPLFAAFGASEAHRDDLIPPAGPGFGPSSSDRMSLGRTVLGGSAANRSTSDEAGPGRSGSAPLLAPTSSAGTAMGPGPLARPAFGGTAFGGAVLGDVSLVGTALGGAAFDAPVPVRVPVSRPTHPAPSRPTHPAVSRRWASSRVGLGTAAAAALAVGVLASTAATAGGVTPAGSGPSSVRSVSPAAPAGVSVPGQPGPQMDVVSFFSNPAK